MTNSIKHGIKLAIFLICLFGSLIWYCFYSPWGKKYPSKEKLEQLKEQYNSQIVEPESNN